MTNVSETGWGGENGTRKVKDKRPSAIQDAATLLWGDKAALFSMIFLVVLVIASLLAPVLFGEAATGMNMEDRFIPPGFQNGYILGTDQMGRDMLGRILLASRSSLAISGVVVLVSMSFGSVLGLISGYYGGRLDDVIMRFVDVAMGFPSLLLALVVIYALGPNVVNVILVLAATRWMFYSRLTRAETMKISCYQYVEASRGVGSSDFRITTKHVLPNLVGVVFTLATLELGVVILAESSLSFLGLGVQPPDASLGLLIAQAKEYIISAWWAMFFPGLAIFLSTMSLNLLSGWLVIALDPVQRWRLRSKKAREGTAATAKIQA